MNRLGPSVGSLAVVIVLGVALGFVTSTSTPPWTLAVSWGLWGTAFGSTLANLVTVRRVEQLRAAEQQAEESAAPDSEDAASGN